MRVAAKGKNYESIARLLLKEGKAVIYKYNPFIIQLTNRRCLSRNLERSHINDAYTMSEFQPKHRNHPMHLKKKRRNNQCLEKFYDVKCIDSRDGKVKSGQQLSNDGSIEFKKRIVRICTHIGKKIVQEDIFLFKSERSKQDAFLPTHCQSNEWGYPA